MGEYDAITAAHYAAYRPPLHGPILERLLGNDRSDVLGLDVGCGTGRSSVALAKYCRYVFATDPSAEMLAHAPEHPAVEFRRQTPAGLARQLPGSRFGLVSFAGSLFYQNTAEVIVNFPSLLTPEATVLVYDFDVDFSFLFNMLNFTPPPGNYDHRCGFDGYPGHGLTLKKDWSETLTFTATPTELTHLICSVKEWREILLRGDSFGDLAGRVGASFIGASTPLKARCFGKVYQYASI